jgi:HEAT repeat protein
VEGQVRDAESDRIEQLLLDIARVHQWNGLYAPGHPFLGERVLALHAGLMDQAAREPSRTLLLGVLRDKVLYRDRFLEARHPLVLAFAEGLYRLQVATIGFGDGATPEGLSVFFRCLRDLQAGKTDEIPEGYLQREGAPGIFLSPINYKDVLSRGIVGRDPLADPDAREEALWRMLLADQGGSDPCGGWGGGDLSEFPEILPAILRRARGQHSGRTMGGNADTGAGPAAVVPQEVLQRMFQRIGQTLKSLPEERRTRVLESLEEGMVAAAGFPCGSAGGAESPGVPLSLARSLSEGYSDSEFLELLAGLVSLEGKGGTRLLRTFEIIAGQRDVKGSLLPTVKSWSREGRHAKDYYEGKTWNAVERLLLGRSEEAYLGDDHSQFLESLSNGAERKGKEAEAARIIDPMLAEYLEPAALRRKGIVVLIDLLEQGVGEEECLILLEAVREEIQGLIEWKEFSLLRSLLDKVAAAGKDGSASRRESASQTLASVDYQRLVEICLAGPGVSKECAEGLEILARNGDWSTELLLERLLVEPDKGMRKMLLSLLVRIGEPAIPPIVRRLQDFPWYFLRNLCFILGEIGASATVPGLVRMLFHKENRVRREAIHALGKLRATDPDAVSALGKILLSESLFGSSKEDPVRIDAGSALSRIGGTEALSYLYRGKKARRTAVREHCEALLRLRGRA